MEGLLPMGPIPSSFFICKICGKHLKDRGFSGVHNNMV